MGSCIMAKKQPIQTCRITLQVPFHDLDPMQVVWHGNYYKYFDLARFELFHQSGIELYGLYKKTGLLLPITRTNCKHIASLSYGDEFTCTASLIEAHIKIVIDFEIRRIADNILCATARGEQVAVQMPEKELLLEIPEYIRHALDGTV
ncbi:MAG: acyl-CoA thioesterase [Deltaproteobacteria bacterium]|nr:MAG: acyl-CoA thioesterase [Deltaproteobacteria bacterium]